jgi:tetratricopeptide (TPR) repeat protein
MYTALLLASSLLLPSPYFQASSNTLPVRELCNEARRQLNEQKYSEARETASKALQLDARSAEVLTLLGQSEFALGNLTTAERRLTEALRIDPTLTETHRALGATFLRQGQFNEARGQFETVLRSHPDDISSLYGLGFSLLSQDKPSQALKPLTQAYHMNPSDSEILTVVMQAYLKLGQLDQAELVLNQLNRRLANDYAPQMRLAEILVNEGAYNLAIVQFQNLLKLRPGSYELNYDLALAYHRAGKEDEAAAQIHSMLSQQGRAELENLLGEVEEKRNNYAQALAAYRKAMELQPKSEEYQLDYATELNQHWNPTEALRAFSAGVKTFPSSVPLWMGLGGTYYLLGKYPEASETLLHTSQMAPDNPNVYALLGLAYDAAGLLQKAIEQRFVDYVKAHPSDALGHYFYGKILLDQNQHKTATDLDQAQHELSRAVELNPKLAQAHLELAKLFQMRDDTTAVRTQLETVIKLNPESSDAYYRLIPVYRKLGEPEKAAIAAEKFRQLKDKQNESAPREQVKKLLSGPNQ